MIYLISGTAGAVVASQHFPQKHRIAVGLNYYPVPEIAIKAEYSCRFLPAAYNPEPSVSLGVCYMALFRK